MSIVADELDYTQTGKEIIRRSPPKKVVESIFRPEIPIEGIVEKVSKLLRLPENWDSYGSCTIKPEVGAFSIFLAASLLRPNMSAPSIVPIHNGGIQLEWHQNQADLEIAINEPYKGEVYFFDQRSGREICEPISGDFYFLEPYISRLSSVK